MYTQALFTYQGEIMKKDIMFIFLPDFRQDVTVYKKGSTKKFYTDTGLYSYRIRFEDQEYHRVYAPRGVKWFLEKEQNVFIFYVVPWTKEIITQFGERFNRKLNEIFKDARRNYYATKQRELRLYFYESGSGQITNVCNESVEELCDKYQYLLSDDGVRESFIGGEFYKTTEDCFIIGRVKTTLGTNKGELVNAVEPIIRIYAEDSPEQSNNEELQQILLDLLKFTVRKTYEFDLLKMRKIRMLRPGLKNATDMARYLNAAIQNAFESADIASLRGLHRLIYA